MKGKPWTMEEEKRIRQLLAEGKSVRVIARALGKTRDCVRMKVARLGLEVVVQSENQPRTTTSCLELPPELPSIEYALKLLVAAMEQLRGPGLDKTEILRLRSLIHAATVYQAKVAEFIDYRGIEAKIAEMEERYERLLGEKTKDMERKQCDRPISATNTQ